MFKTIYISGPIRGTIDGNRLEFSKLHEFIAGHDGWTPLMPHDIEPFDHSGECPWAPYEDHYDRDVVKHSEACYLRGDLVEMLDCDAVAMLPGWERSMGARLEHTVAAQCGMDIYYWSAAGHVLRCADGTNWKP